LKHAQSQMKSIISADSGASASGITALLYPSGVAEGSDVSSLAGVPTFTARTLRTRKEVIPPFISAVHDAVAPEAVEPREGAVQLHATKGESVPHRAEHVPDDGFRDAAGLLSARSHRGLHITLERRQMDFHAGDHVLSPMQTPRLIRSRSADASAASDYGSQGSSRIGRRLISKNEGDYFPMHPRINQSSRIKRPKSTGSLHQSVPESLSGAAGVPHQVLNANNLRVDTVVTNADLKHQQPLIPGPHTSSRPAGRPSSRPPSRSPSSTALSQRNVIPPWMRDDASDRLSELRYLRAPLTAR